MTVPAEEFDPLYTMARDTVARRSTRSVPVGAAAAVLLLPTGKGRAAWQEILTGYCMDHRYAIVAVATTLAGALAVVASGTARVVVVGKPDHLPCTGSGPRIEFVTTPHAVTQERRPQRKTREER